MAMQEDASRGGDGRGSRSRWLANRALIVAAMLAIAVGAGWGQALITWLNATLL